MKNNVLVTIVLLCILSCKKNTLKANVEVVDSVKTISLPFTSELLKYNKKDKNGYFIYDKSFKHNKMFNALSRIYGKYILNGKVKVFIVERKSNDDEHNEPLIVLYSFYDNKKMDSLIIYENVEWESSYKKRFDIIKTNEVHIFEESEGNDFNDDGTEILIKDKSYEIYNISQDGKFSKKTKSNLVNPSLENNKWEGKYHFEAFNKDQIKSSFDIIIKTLENISLTAIEGDDKETYSDLAAEKVAENKIKVTYNASYEDDMGIVYIEKEGSNYYISGNPIYFINPGTNEGTLVKTE
jgi:hypothetical protein